MKIIADKEILYLQDMYCSYAELICKQDTEIKAEHLIDASILIIRSTTKVDHQLLHKANKLKYVATATTGTDHIDKDLLAAKNIKLITAKGCNSQAVAQYTIQAILTVAVQQNISLQDKKVAIIGAGNVGTELTAILQALNINYILCDPFTPNPKLKYHSLDQVLNECDIITLHTPLTTTGNHPTYHLINSNNINQLKPNAWLINTSRGAVCDNKALINWKLENPQATLILDVWENEPKPLVKLVNLATIATPHIAGYSIESKEKAANVIFKKLAQEHQWEAITVNKRRDLIEIIMNDKLNFIQLLKIMNYNYNIELSTKILKTQIKKNGNFKKMRDSYKYHKEFSAFCIKTNIEKNKKKLNKIGFKCN